MSHTNSPPQPRRATSTQDTGGMSLNESPRRAARTRTAVPTYNLKALTRIAGRSLQQDFNEDLVSVNPRSNSHAPSTTRNKTSRAESPRHGPQQTSKPASRIASPMQSTDIPAFGTSPAGKLASTGMPKLPASDTGRSAHLFDCFNTQDHPRGHYYSALELFKRGVWIGYLAPGRHDESFGGLPSFNKLKTNYEGKTNPHPPPVLGAVGNALKAICRGCANERSAAVDLSEIQYVRSTKLVVMPLDGDDESGMFCVMIQQLLGGSLAGIPCYRPYEITGEGDGDRCTNNYMLLALQTASRDPSMWTLDAVLEVLPLQERQDINHWLVNRPKPVPRGRSAFPSPTKTPKKETPLPIDRASITRKHGNDEDDGDEKFRTEGPSSLKRRKSSAAGLQKSASGKKGKGKKGKGSLKPKGQHSTDASIPRSQRNAPISPGSSASPSHANMSPAPTEVLRPSLTHEQASRIQFIWRTTCEETEIEFVHTLDELKTFQGLLGLLEEEAEGMQSASNVLSNTKVWRMTYKLGDAGKKAIVVRKGTEVGFDRLLATVTSSSFLSDRPHALLDIEVTPLS